MSRRDKLFARLKSKPHPGKIINMYIIDGLLRVLTEEGLI